MKQDPDGWIRKAPLSRAELAQLRQENVDFMEERGLGPIDGVFTCDSCNDAPICKLAFDAYNTNGDCLMSK